MTDTRRLPFASSCLSLVSVIVGAKVPQESALGPGDYLRAMDSRVSGPVGVLRG